MASLPHKQTPLSDPEKQAYRNLLYWAMLDIRTLCQSRGRQSWNPLVWRKQYLQSRLAGAIADWLHNLADSASTNFDAFASDWFWEEYESLCRRFGDHVGKGKGIDYKERFKSALKNPKRS